MKSYCLNCRKDTEIIDWVPVIVGQWYYESVQYAVVKNLNLLKTKKQKDY